MLDTIIITQDALHSQTPVISDASGDDSEEDTARVYFGPFKTPEKQFTAVVAIPDPARDSVSTTPSQNLPEPSGQSPPSPTPSTSTCSDEFMDVERLVGLVEGRKETQADTRMPQEPSLPEDDEPSAVLASRLLRALDNPSPPPSPTLAIHDEMDGAEVDEEGSVSSGECEILPADLLSSPQRIAPAISSPPSISNPSSEPDLMTFDSIDDLPEPINPSTSSSNENQAPPSPFSFFDSLDACVSTSHQTTELFQGVTDTLVDVKDEFPAMNTPSPAEVTNDKQVDSTINGTSESQQHLPTSSASHGVASDAADAAGSPGVRIPTPALEDLPHTPLRRSTRPRKSATPHLLKYLSISSPSGETSSLPSTPSDVQTRKSKKGKERNIVPTGSSVAADAREQNVPQSSALKLDEKPADVKAQRRYSRSPIRREPTRELGSLSPNSADLLTQLIPSVSSATESTSSPRPDRAGQGSSSTSDYPLPSTNDDEAMPFPSSHKPVTSTPGSASGRFSSPARIPVTPRVSYIPQTPSKLRPQPFSMDDPSRTPARRIPIEQAVAEGHISPQKLSQMHTGTPASVSLFSGQALPVLNTSLKGDASPARRVFNISSTSHEATSRPESPYKYRLAEASNQQPNRAADMHRPASQKATSASQPTKLPFPLIAPAKAQSISEKDGGKASESSGLSSPAKSALKQTTSRIPRSKPYSKPKVAPAAQSAEQRSIPKVSASHTIDLSDALNGASSSRRPITTTANTSRATSVVRNDMAARTVKRVIRAVDLSKSSANKQSGPAPTLSPPDVVASPIDPSTESKAQSATATGNLKRKRLDSKVRPVASLRSTTLRQVPKPTTSTLTTGANRSTAPSSVRSSNQPSSSRQQDRPVQKPSVIKFRRVMLPGPLVPPPPVTKESEHSVFTSLPESDSSWPADGVIAGRPPDDNMVLSSPNKETTTRSPQSSPHTLFPAPSPPPPPPLVFLIDPLSPVSHVEYVPSETTNEEEALAPSARRTSQSSKQTQAQSGPDVFSTDPNTASSTTRPLQRRRPNASQSSRSNTDDVFSGMSMNALKALTANNTARNQHYAVAMLETQIIRKEGTRPESPAVKIKTIQQRQQEEKARQREERAARRAKRHGDDSYGDEENIDAGHESPIFTSDLPGHHLENALMKHKRGAGDEEDYETPLKNIDGAVNGKRRVKWDKGLFTEVFLDEVVLGLKAPPKENVSTKGCLTPGVKTLRLDNLGNLVDLDNPFCLSQENVVVKKFVYDDDDVEVAPQPATPVVRNTRSKSKKNKT